MNKKRSRTALLPAAFLSPMAALSVKSLPENADWLYEVKFDGYRAVLIKNGKAARLLSRNEKDLTATYPTIIKSAQKLNAVSAVVDGEIVALDQAGRPYFQALQRRSEHANYRLAFYAFDLMHLDGIELTRLPLEQRRQSLEEVVRDSGVLLSAELPGTPTQIVDAVRALGLEGVVAKRRGSTYSPGERSGDWVKMRFNLEQEFVVGGYSAGNNSFDAILVGYYDANRLKFSGKVRAGFIAYTRRELGAILKPLRAARCPFPDLPDAKQSRWGGGVTAADMAKMQWLQPSLVVQVRFLEWTADGRLRHASYIGLRPDKAAIDVRRES